MPTLIRLVVFLVIAAGLVYGALFVLANFVVPGEREIRIELPSPKLEQ